MPNLGAHQRTLPTAGLFKLLAKSLSSIFRERTEIQWDAKTSTGEHKQFPNEYKAVARGWASPSHRGPGELLNTALLNSAFSWSVKEISLSPSPQALPPEQEFTHLFPFWVSLVASCKTSQAGIKGYERKTKQRATQTLLASHFKNDHKREKRENIPNRAHSCMQWSQRNLRW